ncbi:MAG: threonylcarbamoyl-AMP synthase [Marine Group III euryarchaeote CG-Epi1]|jgi:L-threonylcarbamoyladenylate synthase|uniref:L-threonylcarbamoyladenylate synthase n=1 Tax=Marine Group III euryarchaeote CG-Epi1 TaxID=1888995 RepID=A0A1J5T5F8_9ARCH|nr:MAG: threonylcarbamoyl-AMP synthase [Marine Group III euryarchaeote CG-Epi1]|tara:strand:- start:7 stop:582 length:576 start_codon:yes stop_codon:yes gene_type:complete
MLTIDEARSALKKGKIIVYPTDTVWGIGCNPFDQESVNNLFNIKGKKENGVSILVNNVNLISEYCITNKTQKDIIEKLFPGPVTAILKSKVEFAKGVTRNGNIAIRIPKNNTSVSLAKKNPIITTSANIHGENIAKNLNEAKKIFGNSCIYLDGEKPSGVESTIIDLTKDTPKIVRIGALYGSTLENIIGH